MVVVVVLLLVVRLNVHFVVTVDIGVAVVFVVGPKKLTSELGENQINDSC